MNDYPKFKVSKLENLWGKECFFVFALVTSLLFHKSSWYLIVRNNATHWNPVHCVTKIGNIILFYTVSLLINCYVNPSQSLFRGHLYSRDICFSPEGVPWIEVPMYQNTQCLFAFVFWKHVAHMAILSTLFGHVTFLSFWEAIIMFCSLKMLFNCQDVLFLKQLHLWSHYLH